MEFVAGGKSIGVIYRGATRGALSQSIAAAATAT